MTRSIAGGETSRTPSRRRFLATAASAVAAPCIVPASVLGQNPPSDRLTIGSIGTGFQWKIDASAFVMMDDVRIVAVCDPDASRREESKAYVEDVYAEQSGAGSVHGVDMIADFRDLLARDDIDAVTIATPDHWHGIMAVAACDAGKDMYCQKPLSYTIAEGRAVADAVRRSGVVFQTGSQQRSMENFRFACELVRNGRIGELERVEVGLGGPGGKNVPDITMPVPDGFDYDMWLGPAPWASYTEKRCHYTFRNLRDYAWGLVTDWGAHHVDTAQWGMGTDLTGPVAVEGTGENWVGGLYDAPCAFDFTYHYAGGVTMRIADSSHLPLGIRFIGSEGSVFITRGLGGIGDISAEPSSILTSIIGSSDTRLYRHRGRKRRITWRPGNIHNTLNHYINFVDCTRTREPTAAPAEVAHRSVSICHIGRIAMDLGRPLAWDPDAERFVADDQANRLLMRPMRSPWTI